MIICFLKYFNRIIIINLLKEFYKIIKILEEKRKNNNLIVIKIETDLNLNNEDKLLGILEENNIELNIFEKQLSTNDKLINKPIQ